MTPLLAGAASALALDVPVDPDGDQARQWIIEELSKPEYQAAKPSLWDQLSQAFWDWLTSLQAPGGVLQGPLLALLFVVIVGIVVAAFIIFGRPRRNRRSASIGSLFGDDDEATADDLRRSASSAAARGDWALAIEELYRSLARRMTERVLVSTSPGTTARGFADRAGTVFPAFADRLGESAGAFDAVRYLGQAGSEADYKAIVALDKELRAARPATAETVAP